LKLTKCCGLLRVVLCLFFTRRTFALWESFHAALETRCANEVLASLFDLFLFTMHHAHHCVRRLTAYSYDCTSRPLAHANRDRRHVWRLESNARMRCIGQPSSSSRRPVDKRCSARPEFQIPDPICKDLDGDACTALPSRSVTITCVQLSLLGLSLSIILSLQSRNAVAR